MIWQFCAFFRVMGGLSGETKVCPLSTSLCLAQMVGVWSLGVTPLLGLRLGKEETLCLRFRCLGKNR